MCTRRPVATENGIAEAIHKLAIVTPFAYQLPTHRVEMSILARYSPSCNIYISYLHIEICNWSDIAHH